jgi:thiol-disulfide isomerase/thioredoxin
MRKLGLLAFPLFLSFLISAQTGYNIRISLKNCPDSTVYLARYYWDQLPVVDSCKNIRNGNVLFKGAASLERGVYFIANQKKDKFYFQFIVEENQKLSFSADVNDVVNTQKADDRQNQEFFAYVRFMTQKNRELAKSQEDARGKKDSAALVSQKHKELNAQTTKFDADFMKRNKGSFVHDLLNLKAERYATDVPLASNGRPDSVYQYYYYRNHFFDGVNFKDDRLVYTPFFASRIKQYFEQLVPQFPDSVIRELDRVLKQCVPGTSMYQTLVGHFAHKYEQNKTMTFDQFGRCHSFEKVFVHLADNYIIGGKMKGYYSEETEKLITDKINIIRHLLPDARVPDLYMIDTIHGAEVKKMGFDTARSSESATYIYNRNIDRLRPLFKSLYSVKAKYTVLVFWAEDCGHCRKEVPKLHEAVQKLKGKVDFRVFAVQTKEDLFNEWKKFISDQKLTDFIHVFDPVHLNNLKEQFDIDATPVIYLLDRDKKIKGKKLTPEQVVDIIENLERIEKNLNK